MRLVVTPGQWGDAPQAKALLAGHKRGEVGCVIADTGYDSDAIRGRVRSMRSRCCIKPSPCRRGRKRYNRRRYKSRNRVERFYNRIRRCRRVATRYEKKAENYAGFVWLAAFVTAEV